MEKEENLKQNLLKQIDSTSRENTAEKIIARNTSRVKRIKRITITSWMLTIAIFTCVAVLGKVDFYCSHDPDTIAKAVVVLILPMLEAMLKPIIFVSVFVTVALYIRSRTLSISQIHIRLARIEDQLKNIIDKN